MDGAVNFPSDLLGNLVKKDGKEITIENIIGPNEDVIRITYRRGITAGEILVDLDVANDFLLANAEGELSLGDIIPPSAELMLIPSSIAGSGELNNFFRDKRHKLIDKIIIIFELTKNQLSHILYKDGNYHRVNILNDVLINNELLDSNREKLPNVILEFMYSIYMMNFMDPNVQEIFSDLDTFRNKKVEALLLCREFLKDIGYDPDQVGLTKEELTNDNLFSKLKEIMDKLSENYVSRNVKTIDSRKWYFDNKKEIEKIIEEYFEIPINKYSEEKAKLAVHLRNLLRIKSREFFKVITTARSNMINDPVETWQYQLEKYSDYEGVLKWKKIVEGSMRGRDWLDRNLGLL